MQQCHSYLLLSTQLRRELLFVVSMPIPYVVWEMIFLLIYRGSGISKGRWIKGETGADQFAIIYVASSHRLLPDHRR